MSTYYYKYQLTAVIAFIFCCLNLAEVKLHAQNTVTPVLKDSIAPKREAPKARARRHREADVPALPTPQDSLRQTAKGGQTDSLVVPQIAVADSVDRINTQAIEAINKPINLATKTDSLPPLPKQYGKQFIPDPAKATWLALVFPGGGQIYNRKYWKLPIIYGGFAGCAYALSWNSKMYKDYSQAYRDIMDDNPNTNSWQDLLSVKGGYDEAYLKTVIKRQKDSFRRYRDLSIFAFIGVYLISVVDAYVDAELSNFDISPDLSMRVEPTVINNQFHTNQKSVGVQCVLRF
ncbi:MAG: hypothetical protein EOM31_04425 [Bacteroidia bacterium]|nr:hypothetical protein [Bacteroidia bacterium]